MRKYQIHNDDHGPVERGVLAEISPVGSLLYGLVRGWLGRSQLTETTCTVEETQSFLNVVPPGTNLRRVFQELVNIGLLTYTADTKGGQYYTLP